MLAVEQALHINTPDIRPCPTPPPSLSALFIRKLVTRGNTSINMFKSQNGTTQAWRWISYFLFPSHFLFLLSLTSLLPAPHLSMHKTHLTSITGQKFKEPNWPHLSQCWMQMEFLLSGEVQLFTHPHLQSALKPAQPVPAVPLLTHLMRLTAGKRGAN